MERVAREARRGLEGCSWYKVKREGVVACYFCYVLLLYVRTRCRQKVMKPLSVDTERVHRTRVFVKVAANSDLKRETATL